MNKFFKKTEFKLFLTIWIVYTFFISTYGGSYIAESNIHQTMAIVDHWSFEVDNYMKEGCKLSGCDYSFYNGHFYSGFAPGTSFLIIPFYLILKPFDITSVSGYSQVQITTTILIILSSIFLFSLVSALTAVLIYKFVSKITNNKRHQILIPLIFAFCTSFFVYSTGFYSRVISTFLLFLAFYLLFEYKNKRLERNIYLFVSGFAGGFAVTIDFPSIIALGLLFLYLLSFSKKKSILIFIMGALIPLIFLALYNYSVYDTFSPSQYTYRAVIQKDISYGASTIGFIIPSFDRAVSFLFSFKYGLFIYMPILLISIIGFYLGIRNKHYSREMILFLFIFLLQFLFYISYTISDPCSFGLRYFLPTLPFLIIPIVFVLDKGILFYLTLILSSFSLINNFLGTSLYYGCILEDISYYFKTFFSHGLSNYTLTFISMKVMYFSDLFKTGVVLVGLGVLSIIIYLIWKR